MMVGGGEILSARRVGGTPRSRQSTGSITPRSRRSGGAALTPRALRAQQAPPEAPPDVSRAGKAQPRPSRQSQGSTPRAPSLSARPNRSVSSPLGGGPTTPRGSAQSSGRPREAKPKQNGAGVKPPSLSQREKLFKEPSSATVPQGNSSSSQPSTPINTSSSVSTMSASPPPAYLTSASPMSLTSAGSASSKRSQPASATLSIYHSRSLSLPEAAEDNPAEVRATIRRQKKGLDLVKTTKGDRATENLTARGYNNLAKYTERRNSRNSIATTDSSRLHQLSGRSHKAHSQGRTPLHALDSLGNPVEDDVEIRRMESIERSNIEDNTDLKVSSVLTWRKHKAKTSFSSSGSTSYPDSARRDSSTGNAPLGRSDTVRRIINPYEVA